MALFFFFVVLLANAEPCFSDSFISLFSLFYFFRSGAKGVGTTITPIGGLGTIAIER
jgi:hypothetical protein